MNASEQIRNALLRGRRPNVRGQSAASRRRGDGYEFAELRGYVMGDDPRRIDWAATARAGALQTRVVLEESALVLGGILDDSRSMSVGKTTTRCSDGEQALATWFGVARASDRSIRIGSTNVIDPRQARGATGARAALAAGAPVDDLTQSLANAGALLPRGAALLVITDAFGDVDDAILSKIGTKYDATLLFARDPWATGLPLGGFVRMRDAESGLTRRLFIGAKQRAEYLEAVAQREQNLRGRFENAGWRFGLLQSDPAEDLRRLFVPTARRSIG